MVDCSYSIRIQCYGKYSQPECNTLRVSAVHVRFVFFTSTISLTFSFKTKVYASRKMDTDIFKLTKAIRWLFLIWSIGSIIEIIHSSGVPLLWAFTGSSKNYTDFGIASFHGLINSVYLSLMGCLYLKSKVTGERRYLTYTLIVGCWPIFMLGRGIMLTVIIQLLIIQFFYSGITSKKLFSMASLAIIVTILFGILGDIRGTENPFQGIVSTSYEQIFTALPSGFLWVYIYLNP